MAEAAELTLKLLKLGHGAPNGAPRLFKETRMTKKTPKPKPAQPPLAR
jgi:hypothetical protein